MQLARGPVQPARIEPGLRAAQAVAPIPPVRWRRVQYPIEQLSTAERDRLAPHVTSLESPVFALVNLPETVKGALFARYSRYPGTLRRLFSDEFAASCPAEGAAWEGEEGRRAA